MSECVSTMSNYEVVAVIVSICAFLATGVNAWFYQKLTSEYNELVRDQNKIAQGQAETAIRSLIMSARHEVASSCERLTIASREKDDTKKMICRKLLDAAEEDLRNAYEEACSRYLDDKVDKERFKRMYFGEIKNLVEHKEQKVCFMGPQSPYKAILKVYDEWNNLEKEDR